MKKLNSTEPSTAELETKVRELLPLPHCNLAFDLFDELQQRRAAKAGRSTAAANTNKRKAEAVRVGVNKALDWLVQHGTPAHKLTVRMVRNLALKFGPSKFELSKVPSEKVVRGEIEKKRCASSGVPNVADRRLS